MPDPYTEAVMLLCGSQAPDPPHTGGDQLQTASFNTALWVSIFWQRLGN